MQFFRTKLSAEQMANLGTRSARLKSLLNQTGGLATIRGVLLRYTQELPESELRGWLHFALCHPGLCAGLTPFAAANAAQSAATSTLRSEATTRLKSCPHCVAGMALGYCRFAANVLRSAQYALN